MARKDQYFSPGDFSALQLVGTHRMSSVLFGNDLIHLHAKTPLPGNVFDAGFVLQWTLAALSSKKKQRIRSAGKEPTIAFSLHIEAFANGQTIPVRYTCDGTNRSPALSWSGEPEATESFVLVVDDPDAPVGTWNHWLLYDIPAQAQGLDEAFDPGQAGLSGTNDFGQPAYGGPCPPPGHGPHRYFFKLFALTTATLGLPQGARRHVLDTALQGHVIAEASHIGTYERKR